MSKTKICIIDDFISEWLCSVSPFVSLVISPVTVSYCRRKSTRLTSVVGGLITAFGCLFASFATKFHQVFLSYCFIVGIGVGLGRDTSSIMLGQYFKRKRECVEIVLFKNR